MTANKSTCSFSSENKMFISPRLTILLFSIFCLTNTSAIAQGGRVGEQIPQFQLQSTDGRFLGIRYANNLVSVIHLIGFD